MYLVEMLEMLKFPIMFSDFEILESAENTLSISRFSFSFKAKKLSAE